jgi:hypothetical protein
LVAVAHDTLADDHALAGFQLDFQGHDDLLPGTICQVWIRQVWLVTLQRMQRVAVVRRSAARPVSV